MQRVLVVVVTLFLFATVAVGAGAAWFPVGTHTASGLTEPAQFKKKGKGFKKKGFAKGGKARGKGPHCFNRCISQGNATGRCSHRCR